MNRMRRGGTTTSAYAATVLWLSLAIRGTDKGVCTAISYEQLDLRVRSVARTWYYALLSAYARDALY
eukprot:1418554-Rhodomonas_salina.3